MQQVAVTPSTLRTAQTRSQTKTRVELEKKQTQWKRLLNSKIKERFSQIKADFETFAKGSVTNNEYILRLETGSRGNARPLWQKGLDDFGSIHGEKDCTESEIAQGTKLYPVDPEETIKFHEHVNAVATMQFAKYLKNQKFRIKLGRQKGGGSGRPHYSDVVLISW